ncbi:unnamed protein product [Closterium sp. NIES-53]
MAFGFATSWITWYTLSESHHRAARDSVHYTFGSIDASSGSSHVRTEKTSRLKCSLTLAALGFAPSTTDPSLFLRTDTSMLPFYVLAYVDDLVFATADTEALSLVKSELQKRHACTDLDESVEPSGLYLELTGCVITLGMGLVLGGQGSIVLTGHADASWVDDLATQQSSSCEAEIYAEAMAAQDLRWLTYLLTDLGERPRFSPVLYVDNKAMIALCQEHRLEHRTKHIALRYFLARELQQHGQLRLAYMATWANTADIFTKAL